MYPLCMWLRKLRPREFKRLAQNNRWSVAELALEHGSLNSRCSALTPVKTHCSSKACKEISGCTQRHNYNDDIEAWNPLNAGNDRKM